MKEKPVPKKLENGVDKVNGVGGKEKANGEIAVMPAKTKKRKHEDGMSTVKVETDDREYK